MHDVYVMLRNICRGFPQYLVRTWAVKFGDACVVNRQRVFAFFCVRPHSRHSHFFYSHLTMSHYQGHHHAISVKAIVAQITPTKASVDDRTQEPESIGTPTMGAHMTMN